MLDFLYSLPIWNGVPVWIRNTILAALLLVFYYFFRRLFDKDIEPMKPAKVQLDEFKERQEQLRLEREAQKKAEGKAEKSEKVSKKKKKRGKKKNSQKDEHSE